MHVPHSGRPDEEEVSDSREEVVLGQCDCGNQ